MSGDYHAFEGTIIPMEWGTATYTVLPLPNAVSDALAQEGAKRVEGEIGDYPVNLALTKAPVIDAVFLYTGKTFLRDSGLSPGEVIDVRLRMAPEQDVEVPEDLTLALRQADRSAAWAALTPGRQRGLIHTVNSAKRHETRTKRIAKVVMDL
ncbi:YdeI/OmpD-associated family protein [Yoonia sp. 208BN28-4]|uniref:YdeI/OmpD-associated family protein n=1 Tax=Yoonia sp. 208BN28-4 TaxID=3126505 RepID=UPI0030B4BDE9